MTTVVQLVIIEDCVLRGIFRVWGFQKALICCSNKSTSYIFPLTRTVFGRLYTVILLTTSIRSSDGAPLRCSKLGWHVGATF